MLAHQPSSDWRISATGRQVPWVSFGWSTEAGAWSRPSASTTVVMSRARRRTPATGYGPLWPVTPGAWTSAFAWVRIGGPAFPGPGPESWATTSGPAVAARVCWYGWLVTPCTGTPRGTAAGAATTGGRRT